MKKPRKTGPYKYKTIEDFGFWSVVTAYRSKCMKWHIEWMLPEEFSRKLLKANCHYCGVEPLQVKARIDGTYLYNGIDRVDNTQGYVIGNVVPCCRTCNLSKRDMPIRVFNSWIKAVAKTYIPKIT